MQILFQELGLIFDFRFPSDCPTDIWIRHRILGREVLRKITQEMNRLPEFLVRLRCPVRSPN